VKAIRHLQTFTTELDIRNEKTDTIFLNTVSDFLNIGVEICPRAFGRLTILNSYITLLAVCVRTPWQSIIYSFLLAAKSAVSGVFASYPHPGGQGLAKP